jgi:hypothetical protein
MNTWISTVFRVAIVSSFCFAGCGGEAPPAGPIELDWEAFRQVEVTTAGGRVPDLALRRELQDEIEILEIVLPPALEAAAGKPVRISGVGCLTPSGVADDGIRQFALLPPFGMICLGCGTPDPRMEWTIFVDSSAIPWPQPDRDPVFATVEGILRVYANNFLGCAFMIDATAIVARPLSEMPASGAAPHCEQH